MRPDLVSAPSRALLTPAEMLVVERKRVPYFAAGSGGMQQTEWPLSRWRETSTFAWKQQRIDGGAKVKLRHVVNENYRPLFDALYANDN
jgi:hypothetical protein